jgi:hypothetical protein
MQPWERMPLFRNRQLLTADADNYRTADDNASPGLHLDLDHLFAKMNRPYDGYIESASTTTVGGPERYHWKGLLWESFAFFGVENSFRLMTDPYFRQLTADKPFWHDYIASVKQWNWRRWDDGDDFLVAYIAHPLQGSVTEFIEIQNDPRGRALRIDDGKEYWKSMFRAGLWATAYSFDQKLGPLGETALGNEGGYNYIIGCPYYCTAYFKDPGRYHVTNNTGIVKLVTTPVVGTLWTLMEDSLDRWISDRVQGDKYQDGFGTIGPKMLRSALNPARSMANAMRWRLPWYRDFQPADAPDVYFTHAPHFLPGDDEVIESTPRYEIFPHFNFISLPVNTTSCSPCRQTLTGYGFGLSSRIATYADLDSDVNYQPNASPVPSDRAGGNATMATFGLRSGYQGKHFALKASLRPGFLSYDKAYETSPSATGPTPNVGRITHFTTALALNGDVILSRHVALRAVLGNTPVRYREDKLTPTFFIPGSYPYITWLSRKIFLSNENWTYQTGAVLRF